MSGKKKGEGKTITLAPKGPTEDTRAVRAFDLRVQGRTYESISEALEVTPWEARELASFGYQRLASEQADELRAQIEARLDDVVRRLYDDLRVATSQVVRNGIYGLILKTDAQRSKLLGLDIPVGIPDATDA